MTDGEKVRRELREMANPAQLEAHLKDVSRQYKEKLSAFKNRTLKSSEVFNLGFPSAIMLSAGLPAKEIVMNQSVLRKHLEKHGIKIEDVQDLVDAIQSPMMIYEWGSSSPAHVVLTDLSLADGRKVTVAIRIDKECNVHEVNQVASVHGKSIDRLLKDMATEKTDFFKDNLKWTKKNPLNG